MKFADIKTDEVYAYARSKHMAKYPDQVVVLDTSTFWRRPYSSRWGRADSTQPRYVVSSSKRFSSADGVGVLALRRQLHAVDATNPDTSQVAELAATLTVEAVTGRTAPPLPQAVDDGAMYRQFSIELLNPTAFLGPWADVVAQLSAERDREDARKRLVQDLENARSAQISEIRELAAAQGVKVGFMTPREPDGRVPYDTLLALLRRQP